MFGCFVALPQPDIGFVIHPVSGVRMGQGRREQWERRTSPGLLFGLAQQHRPVEGHERDLATTLHFPASNFSSLFFYFNILQLSLSLLILQPSSPCSIPEGAGQPSWEVEHKLMILPDWIYFPCDTALIKLIPIIFNWKPFFYFLFCYTNT